LPNPFSNKKKIRNWKRQVRKISTWKNTFINLDTNYLLENHRTHVKIWIDPWYRLTRRNPPQWLRSLIFDGFCEIYLNWKKRLDELNEPYYLKIWLYDPNFIDSEVVVALRGSLDFYDRTFNKAIDLKEFPRERYQNIKLLYMFEWEHFLDEDFYFLTLDELTEADIDKLRAKAIEEELTFNNGSIRDTCFRIKKGDVWVGSMKE
jgi:hypothetical protein